MSAWGQVKVSVLMDQDQFLPGESVPIKVRLVNHSGQTLQFGKDDSWLRLSVQADDSFIVSQVGPIPVSGLFEVPPAKMATKPLNIEPYFTLTRPGHYSVTATVQIDEWGQTVISEPQSFNVISGTRLWEQTFGLPGSGPDGGSPEVRKYLLQQANYLRSQIRLYVRVTDLSEERTFGVVTVGPMVSFSRPQAVIDAESNLHVIYQSGPRVCTYCKVGPSAEVLDYQKREYSAARPRLSAADDGTVSVVGGVRLPQPSDPLPPARTETDEPNR